jgi:hypothetical protein
MASTSDKPKKESLVAPEQPVRPGRRQDAAKNRREERRKQYERNRRQWLITRIAAGAIAVVIVAGIVLLAVNWGRDRNLNQIPDGVQSYNYPQGQHDDNFNSWTEVPPVGGVHNNTWQQCGFYAGQINPGMGVHSMEHGAVWITYSPDLPQDQVNKLKEIADGQDYILVSKYPGLPSPVVASSWGKQLKLESADDDALKQFIRVFKHNQKYTPEYGASCSNGSTDIIG